MRMRTERMKRRKTLRRVETEMEEWLKEKEGTKWTDFLDYAKKEK